MRIHFELTVEGPRLARPRRPRTLVALAALAAALLLPAVALASHVFSDVPTTHTFHTNISNLAGAGVTAGCGGGKYCPDQAVTRGQMAGFLNRGLGRVAEAELQGIFTGVGLADIGTVTITPGTSPGALPGAKQFIHAQFNGTISLSNDSACPCTVNLYLKGASPLHSFFDAMTLTTVDFYFPISSGGVIAVTGSAPVTITLSAFVGPGGNTATAYTIQGNLVVETVPFGHAGTSAP